MATNHAVRQQVGRLVDLGFSQKVIAHKMGLTETTLSRWLNQKGDPPPVINVDQMDAFARYLRELALSFASALREFSAAMPHKDLDVIAAAAPAAPVSVAGVTEEVRTIADTKRTRRRKAGRSR